MFGKGRFLNVFTVPSTHIYTAYTAYFLLVRSSRLAACPAARYIADNSVVFDYVSSKHVHEDCTVYMRPQ